MTTDSALRDKIAKLLADRIGHGLREKTDAVAGEVLDILTAAGEVQPKPVRHSCETDMLSECPGCNADVAKPAPAGMVLVPRKVTEAMNDAYNDVPSGFAGSPPASQWVWDAMLAAAPTTPPPTLNEAFDQVGAAMMREVCGEGAPAAQVAELENCDKCGYMTRNGAKCGCAAPAVVVDEAMVERFCSAADDGFGWSDTGRTQVRRGLAAALKGDV